MSGRYSAARPKRAGEQFARTHQSGSDAGHSPKKPRFDARNPSILAPDAPEEDAILDLDEIGKGGTKTKRNAVNIDGYGSDSSNENFDTRAAAKAKPTVAENDDDDMFADDTNDVAADESQTRKKKGVKFLDEDDIEGQNADSKAGTRIHVDFKKHVGKGKDAMDMDDDDEDSSSSEDADDEERDRIDDELDEELGAGSKKKNAPRIDAFNMKTENEEGRFDDSGNYVRKAADPNEQYDNWMDGISKKDMRRAKEAHEKREQDLRERERADDAIVTSTLLATLITHLEDGETALEALGRLGKLKGKTEPKWKLKKKEAIPDPNDPKEIQRTKAKEAIEAITDAADKLSSRQEGDVYDQERALFMRQYKRETGEDWVDPAAASAKEGNGSVNANAQWEYRWSGDHDGGRGEIHGPYDGPTMESWKHAGYFGDGVEFRVAGSGSDWTRVADFI